MTNARGDEAVLLARQQAAFGAAEAAADGAFYKLPFYSYNVVPSEELNEDDAIQGDAFPGDAVAGLRALAGSMVVPMGLGSIGWHLRALLGAPVTSGAGDFTHVFTTAAQPAVPLLSHGITHGRVAQHFTQDSLAYTGMELSLQKNSERARITFNLAGREEVGAAATLDTTPVAWSPDPVPVGFQGKLLKDGVETAMLTGASVTLNSGVEADQESINGLPTAAGMDAGMWALSGSLDARFRDRTWYDLANAGTAMDLHLQWVLSATLSLEIEAHSIRLERFGIGVSGRDKISSSFNFQANRPGVGATLLTATLKNQVADYANPS